MKVSIVTVCLNAASTIDDCVQSVIRQNSATIEHIVVDGGSTDGTLDILNRHRPRLAHLISEKDNGLYDAMNKGVAMATGDIIGFLNADDVLASPETVARIVEAMEEANADVAYGDVEIFYREGQVARLYRGEGFDQRYLNSVNLPAHPSVYVRSELLRRAGTFDTRFKIAADFDFLLRIFSRFSPATVYLPHTIVRMRGGGVSSRGFSSYWTITRELLEACKSYGIKPNKPAIYGRFLRRGRELFAGLWHT